jgi:hypothetical protein
LLSYSSDSTQDSLSVNKKQLRSILRDNARLRFLEKDRILSDSLFNLQAEEIFNLHQVILSERVIKKNQVIEIDYYRTLANKERRKNKLLVIGTGVLVGVGSYLYITK